MIGGAAGFGMKPGAMSSSSRSFVAISGPWRAFSPQRRMDLCVPSG